MEKANVINYITHEEDDQLIYMRTQDGYVNATAMCKAFGKLWYEYYRLDTTKEFVAELADSLKNSKRENPSWDIIITQIYRALVV